MLMALLYMYGGRVIGDANWIPKDTDRDIKSKSLQFCMLINKLWRRLLGSSISP